MKDKIKITLSPGTWQVCFRDMVTLKNLNAINQIKLKEQTKLSFDIPQELIGNENVKFYAERIL